MIVVYSPKRKKWVTGTQQKVQKSNTEMKMALGVAVTKPNYRHLFLKCNAQYGIFQKFDDEGISSVFNFSDQSLL